MTGMSASPGRAAYGIAKAGVHRLAETAARECRGSGITVNVIAPGIIDTPSNRASMPDARYEEWVSPATIADTVLWLCRPENACSGTVIQYPGGT
jgi:NAD(P)-dependent dehydrogenase (short-subunit alcohol dehydrogenase family)